MAGAYPQGRALRAEDVAAWTAAVRPYLRGPVLDLGAGTGRFTAALATEVGGDVLACEPSAAMRSAFVRDGSVLVGGSAEALPFATGGVATVWASQVLHHVRDLGAFAREVRRVLCPGVCLLLRGGFGPPDAVPLHRWFPAAVPGHQGLLAEATSLLATAGLPVVARAAVAQRYATDTEELIAKAAGRSLSTLAALPDGVFAEGLRELTDDARSGRVAFPVAERLDLMVFGG